MEPAEESVLRYMWRSISWRWRIFGGLVLLGLAAWGISVPVDGWRRARLREEIQAYLATLPPVAPQAVVADEDNAAPAIKEAIAAANLGSVLNDLHEVSLSNGKVPNSTVVSLLERNAEAQRLLEVALGKSGFDPGPPVPRGSLSGPFDLWKLHVLIRAKAVLAFQAGRVGEAVATALLLPRMARRIGPGRAPPWFHSQLEDSSRWLEVLEAAVADPRLDEAGAAAILRDLPAGEEARAAAVADFESMTIRYGGSWFVESLGDDAEEKARSAGWRPPSLHERLLAAIRKRNLPPGVESWPTVGQFREIWESWTKQRQFVGLRGAAAVRKFGPVAREQSDDMYRRDREASFADALRTEMGIEARLEVIRAAAALRLFEMRNGRAPTDLPAGTRDPYTEGPLVFRVDADGWVVSSAGPGAEWASAFAAPPVIRWKRPAPVPQDGGK